MAAKKMVTADTNSLWMLLELVAAMKVSNTDDADIVIFMTCSVREDAMIGASTVRLLP